ncbi:MAG TPA: class I SAM-dependent methyltransferase [Candidatus Saccharimonadales bacterium]|nr:class I SAM-dependent methyltransferase [Candidatus Saccharimonadales bacterium]
MLKNDLKKRLAKVDKVFNADKLLQLEPDDKYIQSYYRASKIGYSLFYSSSAADRMYMGISRDGAFKESDLLEAARTVEKYINKNTTNILELATGRGATSAYLAKKYPSIEFDGIELSPAQLHLAKQKAKKLPNYHPVAGDYHDLSRYKSQSVDIAFVIEALCYSTEKEKVYSEISRVLKKNGVFIIFDGYTTKARSKMSKEELMACRLTEKSMALRVFEGHKSAIKKAEDSGFRVVSDENVSDYIQPSLRRFERYAAKYFDHPRLARTVNIFISKKFIYNAIAGLLMPEVVGRGLLSYYITVLEKK